MGTRAGLIECRNVLYNIQCVGSIGKSLPARIFYSYVGFPQVDYFPGGRFPRLHAISCLILAWSCGSFTQWNFI